MRLTTLKYRLKIGKSAAVLENMASSVNYVWNYCNEANQEYWNKFRKNYTVYELHKLTTGCTKELGIHSHTVQSVCESFFSRRNVINKARLNWRTKKRSLGWVPFKGARIAVKHDTIKIYGHTFRFWLSRPIEGKVRCGSFSKDSKGNWFVNIIIEDCDRGRIKTGKMCGIDLGLKMLITLSDGVSFKKDNTTKKYEQQLSMAQRARKKKRIKAIHTKIKNTRKDWSQKVTTLLVKEYDYIAVGNVSSSRLKKNKLAKSVSDAGWYSLKSMLAYKAIALGVNYYEVNESYSTVTCSNCFERSGPRGLSGLGVRDWVCSVCGSMHKRDVNAAKNILQFSVQGIERQLRETQAVA